MKPRTMLLALVVLFFESGAAWARGFGGSMGVGRGSGMGGRTTIAHSSGGQIHQGQQIISSRGRFINHSVAAFRTGRIGGVFGASRFPMRVSPVAVARVPVFFPHRFPFFGNSGILLLDVPSVDVTTETTPFVPTEGWPQPPANGSPRTDARVRSPGQLAPFDPTSHEVADRMLALAGVRKGDVVYDLGAGDGRMVIAAAKRYGVKAVGFEIDPGLVKLARENIRKQGVEKLVEIRQQDFMKSDLSAATIVTLYLSQDGNLALRPRLMNQLKPGARVVSYTFDMADWAPKITEAYRDAAGDTHLLYYWEISAPELYGDNSRGRTSFPDQSGSS